MKIQNALINYILVAQSAITGYLKSHPKAGAKEEDSTAAMMDLMPEFRRQLGDKLTVTLCIYQSGEMFKKLYRDTHTSFYGLGIQKHEKKQPIVQVVGIS
jgi:hypothetical protein